MGPDVVPRLECHRAAHHRMVRQPARPQAILHDLPRGVHAELLAVRHRTKPRRDDRVSDPARRRGRRPAADGAGDFGRHLSAAAARARVRALRYHRGGRPDPRAHRGRLDHGQLRLALDLSDQPASRHRGFAADFPSSGRSAVAEAARARRNTNRLRRRGAARPRRGRAAGDARQGTGTGLVQLAIHRHACRPRRRGSRVAGGLGVVVTTIPSSTCAFSGISTSSAPTR